MEYSPVGGTWQAMRSVGTRHFNAARTSSLRAGALHPRQASTFSLKKLGAPLRPQHLSGFALTMSESAESSTIVWRQGRYEPLGGNTSSGGEVYCCEVVLADADLSRHVPESTTQHHTVGMPCCLY